MIEATIEDAHTAIVVYDHQVSAEEAESGEFTSLPSGAISGSVDQVNDVTLRVNFIQPLVITSDTTLNFDFGPDTIASPQTIAYT